MTEKIDIEKMEFRDLFKVRSEIKKKVGLTKKMPDDLVCGEWTQQAIKVLKERYLKKDEDGKIIETPDELCWRVAWEMASAESLWGAKKREINEIARRYYEMLVSRDFLPNSPTLMNAGKGNNLQYSACFVLPIDDSLTDIFNAVKYQALIHQSGGGTGFSFSRLRSKGSVVRSTKGIASGPVSFMKIFDAATNEIKQGGMRRGANMGILRVDHPDIIEFIHSKDKGGITNFNISVGITDKFMQAYKKNEEFDLIDPRTGKVSGQLDARRVFDEIAQSAWKTGDPGIIFLDKINSSTANPVPGIGPIESTNPCGEQPLYPYDSCNLGSLFLGNFVKEEKNGKGPIKMIDWDKLKRITKLATGFMDSVIEMNPYTLPQIRKTSLSIRRIGLGVGGWADMLARLEIPYDSMQALELAEKIMKTINESAIEASREMSKTRGPFPLYKKSIYKNKKPRRNSTVTTIAPTGSISIIAGASSGIEPFFAISYQHIVKDESLERTLTFFNPIFEKYAKDGGFLTDEIRQMVMEHGTVRGIEELPEGVKKVFGTAHEIHHDWHIKMQAAFQKYTENAVSKTINLPNEASVEEIKKAYLLSWDTSCKGITVFRDGCKDTQVLNLGKSAETKKEEEITEPILDRPYVASGSTYKINTPVGNAFVTINNGVNGQPLELFINVGKAGSDVTAMAEALGRSISFSLRLQGNLTPKERAREIAFQLAGIGGRRSVGFGSNKVLSLPDAVAMALSNHYNFRVNGFTLPSDMEDELSSALKKQKQGMIGQQNPIFLSKEKSLMFDAADICPSCGASAFVYEEGCSKCHACGHSEC